MDENKPAYHIDVDCHDTEEPWNEGSKIKVFRSRKRCVRRWPEARLVREFRYLRQRYWPGRLLDFEVSAMTDIDEAALVTFRGRCDLKAKRIIINLPWHCSDRHVRETILHELCHAAAEPWNSRGAHDVYFFLEIDKLLAVGAPIRPDVDGTEPPPGFLDLLPYCAELRKRVHKRQRVPHETVVGACVDLPF